MPEIKIDRLIRSHRKTIGLIVNKEAQLIVRAPYGASEDLIHRVVHDKQQWIISKQEVWRQKQPKPKIFAPGEEFLFLGQKYSLVVTDDLPKAVVFDGQLKISRHVLANAKDHLEDWYHAQAREYILQRIKDYAQATGIEYASVRINNAKTHWGSCGHRDRLNFTWRLIMAPPRVIDYVIVHELAHVKVKNHSRKFWSEVVRMAPDFRQDERWLKNNSHLLHWG